LVEWWEHIFWEPHEGSLFFDLAILSNPCLVLLRVTLSPAKVQDREYLLRVLQRSDWAT